MCSLESSRGFRITGARGRRIVYASIPGIPFWLLPAV